MRREPRTVGLSCRKASLEIGTSTESERPLTSVRGRSSLPDGVEARRRGVRQHRAAEDQGQAIAVTELDGAEACDTRPVESVAVTVKL